MQVPEAPKDAPTFMEDLPEEERDTEGLSKYGAGQAWPAHQLSTVAQHHRVQHPCRDWLISC